jgi:protein-tyrosine phosphatase
MHDIIRGIFLGNGAEGQNIPLLKNAKITGVLNVALEINEDPYLFRNGIYAAHCGLVDGPGNSLAAYVAAIAKLCDMAAMVRWPNDNILVHCAEGVSRSPSVVLGYLLVTDVVASFDDGLELIGNIRPKIHDGFMTKYHKAGVLEAAAILKRREEFTASTPKSTTYDSSQD